MLPDNPVTSPPWRDDGSASSIRRQTNFFGRPRPSRCHRPSRPSQLNLKPELLDRGPESELAGITAQRNVVNGVVKAPTVRSSARSRAPRSRA